MSLGKLYVVSGPSGAGKSTVCKEVRKRFLTKEEFENKIKNDEFLEYAKVHENYYGTLKSEVENRLKKGEKIILEIDVQGGIQIKEKFPEANLIFFRTSTKEVLEARLRGRNTDIEQACKELIDIIENEER